MIKLIVLLVPLLNVAWFAWAWWRTRSMGHRTAWRTLLSLFFVAMIFHFGYLVFSRGLGLDARLPAPGLSVAYVWHLLILTPLAVSILLGESVVGLVKLARGTRHAPMRAEALAPADSFNGADFEDDYSRSEVEPSVSRRQFLLHTAVTVPPALTILTGLGGYAQSKRFRVRHLDVQMPSLAKELDGLTIAHLSDLHAGQFVDRGLISRIVTATNELRADIILATGDLIDYSLQDLPGAVDEMRRLDSPGGVYMCEGNHDLFQSRSTFENTVRSAGLGFLVNETANLRLRGRDVQIHGLRWGLGNDIRSREGHDDAGASVHLTGMRSNIDPDALGILLAHHPHAFDTAARMGIPLTLAGHTHGGQLMLGPNTGAGPLMYRYWSGLYQKDRSRLVVSNGVGNWLPLRINAPAELIKITLRSTS